MPSIRFSLRLRGPCLSIIPSILFRWLLAAESSCWSQVLLRPEAWLPAACTKFLSCHNALPLLERSMVCSKGKIALDPLTTAISTALYHLTTIVPLSRRHREAYQEIKIPSPEEPASFRYPAAGRIAGLTWREYDVQQSKEYTRQNSSGVLAGMDDDQRYSGMPFKAFPGAPTGHSQHSQHSHWTILDDVLLLSRLGDDGNQTDAHIYSEGTPRMMKTADHHDFG